MKELVYKIEAADDGSSVKDFLARKRVSKTIIKKAKMGGISVSGETVTVRRILREGDALTVRLPEEKSEGIEAIDIPLTVVYEDEYLIAVDKPTNMPTHPSRGNSLPTLANAVMARFGGDFVFRAVNRLDRDTSGIVLIAKDELSAYRLSKSMREGKFVKKYEAVVLGIPETKEGLIDAPIRRECEGSIKRVVAPDGKPAVTEYKVIKELENSAVCEIRLYTGRTHQIRVHMAHIGHPLVNDFLYGTRESGEYALRCIEIAFPHPATEKKLVVRAKTQIL